MEKINLKKCYIEEHVYTGDYYDPDIVISVAVPELSKRLVELSLNGHAIGQFEKIDHTKRIIPKTVFGHQYQVNFHFLIALDKDFKTDNSKTKLLILKLLNKKNFKTEIESLQKLTDKNDKGMAKARRLFYELVISDLKPEEKKLLENIKKERSLTDEDLTEQMIYNSCSDILKRQFNIPEEYTYILQSIIEHGFDYTIEFIDNLILNNISYLNYYDCIPYYINDPAKIKNDLRCKYTQQPQQRNIKKSLPIIFYFRDKYSPKTVNVSEVNYKNFCFIYTLAYEEPRRTDKEIAERVFGRCGQKEINRIKQTKRRIRSLLNIGDKQ